MAAAAAVVAAADVAEIDYSSSSSPYVRLFQDKIVDDQRTFVCSLPCSDHAHGVEMAVAAINKANNKIKLYNLLNHIETNHNKSWSSSKWSLTSTPADSEEIKQIASLAAVVVTFIARCLVHNQHLHRVNCGRLTSLSKRRKRTSPLKSRSGATAS